jgi:hypothetical protein
LATLTRALVLLCACFCLLPGLITWGDQIHIAVGVVPREEAVSRLFEQAPLFEAANRQLTRSDRIALYGEPRGYYLNVPYMWADYGYHTLFRYEAMATPEDLLAAWRQRGITAVLVNRIYARSTFEGTDTVGRLMRELARTGRLSVVKETKTGILFRIVDDDGRFGDGR